MREILYKYRGRIYLVKPRGTKLKKQQTEGNITYYIMRRDSWLLHVVVSLLLVLAIVNLFNADKEKHIANFSDVIYADNETVHFNLRNVQSNKEKISVRLTYKNEKIVKEILLEPGQELGNVVVKELSKFEEGSYMCTLTYKVISDLYVEQLDYDVLLILRK